MRPIINAFLLVSAVMMSSCCKDKEPGIPYFDFVLYWEGLQEQGSAEATVFDKTWKASAYTFPHPSEPQYFSLIYETYSPDGLLREQILMGSLTTRVGEYKVISDFSNDVLEDNIVNGIYSIYSDDGDVLYSGYSLNEDYDNVVFIDNVDTINHEMEGRFTLLFDLNEADYDKDLAKQVLFENGKFKVKI